MSEQPRKQAPTVERRGAEMLLFLVVSAIGIYALGNGLTGLFEPGKGINLLWLTVSLGAMLLLVSQMGRVHENWPRRRDRKSQQAQPLTQEVVAGEPLAHSEERER
jgi:hypothetical protein